MKIGHSMPFGAELCENGSVRFRLWAPQAEHVELLIENPEQQHFALTKVEDGWFELVVSAAAAGSRYQFRIDAQAKVPDPASRFQPSDVHGPSEVIDPRAFDWKDDHWRGRRWEEATIYELHVGTFSPEGTFQAVSKRLDYLHDLGVSAIELMPIADFPGRRNWGYDGVLPFAPDSSYGHPEDLKRLVQAAHGMGMMIFLDVVYNHFGPEGNYLSLYAPQFFTNRHHTPWGDGINFDGPGSRVVRDFFIRNALYWLEEYHFDGLRLDAVHAIADDSSPDIITELAQVVRQRFAGERFVHLMLEDAGNAARYLRRKPNGKAVLYDAQWNDDIHHAFHVLTTGESDGYYSDYAGQPVQHLCRCLSEGFAYQGDHSEYHGAPRGEPSNTLPPSAFISFLQNHDQVGNRAFGERITRLAPAAALKAAVEILLLAPSPPLLFMGEEFGATTPFLFFCDFQGELADAVTNGRRSEFARFAKFGAPEIRRQIPNPNAEQTYLQSKIDWQSLTREPHTMWLGLYRELLSIRKHKIMPHLRTTSPVRTECRIHEQRGFSASWKFGNGPLLSLHANLSNQQLSIAKGDAAQRIYCSNQEVCQGLENGTLPPWSVVWLLQE